MAARKPKEEIGKVDSMVWLHLAKLRNLSRAVDDVLARQMNQSIDRIIAILNGEACTSEPESPAMLARVAEVIES